MRDRDWNFHGRSVPLLAHAFNLKRGVGVDVNLSAKGYDDAMEKLERKLQCQKHFLRQTEGHYEVKFERALG